MERSIMGCVSDLVCVLAGCPDGDINDDPTCAEGGRGK